MPSTPVVQDDKINLALWGWPTSISLGGLIRVFRHQIGLHTWRQALPD